MAIVHVLWLEYMYYGHSTCTMAIGHVLWLMCDDVWSHVRRDAGRGVRGAKPPSLAGGFGGPLGPPMW